MEELLKKISALRVVNEEIIARVEKLQHVLHYDYFAFLKEDGPAHRFLSLTEVPTTTKGMSIND
jgi:hypothetical protein